MFVADTCHGGGLTREVDPRAAEMSYRQVPRYRIAVDDLKPIASNAEAFLTPLDFDRTTFLAAVDRYTKAPEVRIPGVPGLRGALSYALARAFEGRADADSDGMVTLGELFSNVRQVVYQLSDQRQNAVTLDSPKRSVDKGVAFRLTRGVTVIEAAPSSPPAAAVAGPKPESKPTVATAKQPQPSVQVQGEAKAQGEQATRPVRVASLDGNSERLSRIQRREAAFVVVSPRDSPDLIWDPKTRDVVSGGDVVAYRADEVDLSSIIDRVAAIQGFKLLGAKAPQAIRTLPSDKLHRNGSRIEIEISGVAGRALILFNIAGDGTVQALYPIGSDAPIAPKSEHRLAVQVKEPFGADQVIAITSDQRMPALEQVLQELNRRRSPLQALRLVERYAPPGARIGSTGLFTAP
jgi:hypothetical protein